MERLKRFVSDGASSVISYALDMLDTDLNNQKQKVVGIKTTEQGDTALLVSLYKWRSIHYGCIHNDMALGTIRF